MTTPIPSELKDLTAAVNAAKPGLDRIVARNAGGMTTAVLRLAALSYREDLEADGFEIVDSAGPCVLGVKPAEPRSPDGLRHPEGPGWRVTMAGPTGLHNVHVAPTDQAPAGQVITARARLHWLGFLSNNGVRVPRDLERRAQIDAEREERRSQDDRARTPTVGA